MVQADQGRCFSVYEVAVDGIPNLSVQLLQAVGFCVDRPSDRTGPIGAVIGLLHNKQDLVHGSVSWLKSGSVGRLAAWLGNSRHRHFHSAAEPCPAIARCCELCPMELGEQCWLCHGGRPFGPNAVSLPELDRLVSQAEADASLRQALRRCSSQQELILTARQLGYLITRLDLQRAWQEDQQERIKTTATAAPVSGIRR